MFANFKKAGLFTSLIVALCQCVSNFGDHQLSPNQPKADQTANGLASVADDALAVISPVDCSLPQVQPQTTKPNSAWHPSSSAMLAIRSTSVIPLVFDQLCNWPQPFRQASSLQAMQVRLQV